MRMFTVSHSICAHTVCVCVCLVRRATKPKKQNTNDILLPNDDIIGNVCIFRCFFDSLFLLKIMDRKKHFWDEGHKTASHSVHAMHISNECATERKCKTSNDEHKLWAMLCINGFEQIAVHPFIHIKYNKIWPQIFCMFSGFVLCKTPI